MLWSGLFGGIKRDVADCDMDEDYFGSTASWTGGVLREGGAPAAVSWRRREAVCYVGEAF